MEHSFNLGLVRGFYMGATLDLTAIKEDVTELSE